MITLDPHYSTTRRVREADSAEILSEMNEILEEEETFKGFLLLPKDDRRIGEGGLRTRGYFKQHSTQEPLITIVTVVFNGAQFLEETILSVINQTYSNIEFIIIDGGSTDDTIDIIKKYEFAIDYWVSENDGGIYFAMNKGISLMMGQWAYFLNCQDTLIDTHTMTTLAKLLHKDDLIVHFNCEVRDNSGEEVFVRPYPKFPQCLEKWPCVQHQSVFCQSSVIRKNQGFRTDFKLLADYDFFIRTTKAGINIVTYEDLRIAVYNSEGTSANVNSILLLMREARQIQKYYFGRVNWSLQLQLGFKYIIYFAPGGQFLTKYLRERFLAKR